MHNYIILPSLSTLEAPTPYPIYEKQNNYFAYFFFFCPYLGCLELYSN